MSLLKQNFNSKSFCEHCYTNLKLTNFWILFKQLKVISYFYLRGYAMIYICQNGWSQNFGTPTKCRYKYLLCIVSVLIHIMRVSKQNFIHKEALVCICTLWVSTKRFLSEVTLDYIMRHEVLCQKHLLSLCVKGPFDSYLRKM